jgi:hypothetical protein
MHYTPTTGYFVTRILVTKIPRNSDLTRYIAVNLSLRLSLNCYSSSPGAFSRFLGASEACRADASNTAVSAQKTKTPCITMGFCNLRGYTGDATAQKNGRVIAND